MNSKNHNTIITSETPVDEIVSKHPKAVGWLVERGIICVVCGEPYWGTLGELMERKEIANKEELLQELNSFLKP